MPSPENAVQKIFLVAAEILKNEKPRETTAASTAAIVAATTTKPAISTAADDFTPKEQVNLKPFTGNGKFTGNALRW